MKSRQVKRDEKLHIKKQQIKIKWQLKETCNNDIEDNVPFYEYQTNIAGLKPVITFITLRVINF